MSTMGTAGAIGAGVGGIGSLVGGIGSLFGGGQGGGDPEAAAAIMKAAQDYATDVAARAYSRSTQIQYPWLAAGKSALGQALGLMGLGGGEYPKNWLWDTNIYGGGGGQVWPGATGGATGASPTDIIKATPGYQFRLGQGINALDRSAAAKGFLGSGAHAKGITQYGQDYATNEYYNYMKNLMTMAGLGQGTSADLGKQGIGTGQTIGQIAMGGAGPLASLQMMPSSGGNFFNNLMMASPYLGMAGRQFGNMFANYPTSGYGFSGTEGLINSYLS